MLTVYGIANCDTVKKARRWLDEAGIDHVFHDYKKSPPTAELLREWCDKLGHDALINRRGTTWRQLPESDKIGLDQEKAIALMCRHPSLIKRPVVEKDGMRLLGFDPVQYSALK